jgi:hypothetical protein
MSVITLQGTAILKSPIHEDGGFKPPLLGAARAFEILGQPVSAPVAAFFVRQAERLPYNRTNGSRGLDFIAG